MPKGEDPSSPSSSEQPFYTGAGLTALESETSPAFPSAGDRLGGYTILDELGVGGMGRVYKAKRSDQEIDLNVAIKVAAMPLGAVGFVERFQQEQQILADFDHPLITTLYDVDRTQTGLPYIVMELVDGSPITEYVGTHDLTIPALLKLYLDVIDAVAYAHSRLVLHRDIKPSNVLVDQNGRVKLLDFGIARSIDGTDTAALTEAGLALTPQYASPEQLHGRPATVATDVYQLGALLFELLAKIPLRTKEEQFTIPNPSQVDAAMRAVTTPIPAQLRAIVLACVDKDSKNCYANALAIAEDIKRYLTGYPVLARQANAWFRVAKFVQRNRAATVAAAVTALFTVGMTVAYVVNITAAERAAVAEAETSRALLRTMTDLVNDTFSQFLSAGYSAEQGNRATTNVPLRTVLSRLSNTLEEFQEDATFRADLEGTLGSIYITLEEFAKAEAMLQTAFAKAQTSDLPTRRSIALSLARLFQLQDQIEKAEYWYQQAVVHTPDDVDESIKVDLILSLTRIQIAKAEYQQAYDALTLTLDYFADTPTQARRIQAAESSWMMAYLAMSLSDYGAAEQFAQKSIDLSTAVDGPNGHALVRPYEILSLTANDKGQYEKGKQYQAEALRIAQLNFGSRSDAAANAMSNYANSLFYLGDYQGSLEMTRAALEIFEEVLGQVHSRTARMYNNVCVFLFSLGRIDESIRECQTSADIARQLGQAGKKSLHEVSHTIGAIMIEQGQTRPARPYIEEALALSRELYGPQSAATATKHHRLANLALLERDFQKAVDLARKSTDIFIAALGKDSTRISEAMGVEAEALMHLERTAEAYEVAQQYHHHTVAQHGENHLRTSKACHIVARTALADGRYEEVRGWLAKAEPGLLTDPSAIDTLNQRLIQLELAQIAPETEQARPNEIELASLNEALQRVFPNRKDFALRLRFLQGS